MSQQNWSLEKLRDRITIRAQMALLTAMTSVIAVGAAATGAAVVARRSAVSSANQDLQALARNMADRLDQHMFERYREIQNIAKLAPLQSTWSSDPDAVRKVLQQLQSSLPEYAWLGFASPAGIVQASTKGMLEGASVSERPWFIDGLKHATVEDVHEAKLLDKLLRKAPEDAPFHFVDVAMPVLGENGALAGVLAAHMSWTWADDVRSTVLLNQDALSPAELWVVGRDGSVLIGPVGARVDVSQLDEARKTDGSVFIESSEAHETLTALAPTKGQSDYPGLGWTVVARKPVTSIYAPANHLVLQILLLGGAVALLASFLAWMLAGIVTRPLKTLSLQLDSIGRTETAGVDREHGSLDLLQLSAAVRSLLRRVGSAEAGRQIADAAVGSLQREVEDQKKTADERILRLGADMHHLKILADTDSLTGLLNRRAFQFLAQDAWSSFEQGDRGFSILMFDIDRFKRINDTFGHAVGDDVIRAVGGIISSGIRATDIAARFGGEEFVVLLRDTTETAATALANRLREQIAAMLVKAERNDVRFTASVGIAVATTGDRDLEDVIQCADKALYVAKTGGRNRVAFERRSAADRKAA